MSFVLFEDNHLLVVNKPAGLPTMGVTSNKPSLIEQSRRYIKQKYNKPGNVYLGVVSRLDAMATGVLVFARTSKAAGRLTKQFRSVEVEKTYWAIVSPPPEQVTAEWVDYLYKDERQQKMAVVQNSSMKGAKEARLQFAVQHRYGQFAWLKVRLETGRKHQIRVQCASHGSPVVGDRKYGSSISFPAGIALHSRELILTHPTRDERLQFVAPFPDSWKQLAKKAGLELH